MPSLFYETSKIRDRTNYGIYKGSQPIDAVYYGEDLVYLFQPFEPNTTLINDNSSVTRTLSLPQGKYYVEVVGAGGMDAYGQEGYWARRRGGASGGRFSATINVTGHNHTISMTCGASYGVTSTLNIDGVTVATARGGGNYTNVGTVSTNLNVSGVSFSGTTSRNGNAGEETYVYGGGGSPSGGASVSSLGNYGHGQSNNPQGQYTNGVIYLKYIGR